MSQLHYSSHRTRYGSDARARGGRRGGCLVQGLLSSMERQAREDARRERRRWNALTDEQQDAEIVYEEAVDRLFEAGWAIGGGVLWWIGMSLVVFLMAPETPSVWAFAAVALFTVGIKALAFLSEVVGGFHARRTPAHLRPAAPKKEPNPLVKLWAQLWDMDRRDTCTSIIVLALIAWVIVVGGPVTP